jgi:N4-gp56 family major capsid protein
MFCDTVSADGEATEVSAIGGLAADNNRLTPDMVNKAVTWLKKNKAPTINGKYVAIIHPSVTYDLRSSDEWIEAHKYAAATEIFNGEIGELHGVRFIETTNAKVTENGGKMVYTTIFLGKDAYGIVDPEGGGLEMIVKDKSEVGGPLEQYSTAGYKFESATKILYPERMVLVKSCSVYSNKDSAN